jgi:hypothetical protein
LVILFLIDAILIADWEIYHSNNVYKSHCSLQNELQEIQWFNGCLHGLADMDSLQSNSDCSWISTIRSDQDIL